MGVAGRLKVERSSGWAGLGACGLDPAALGRVREPLVVVLVNTEAACGVALAVPCPVVDPCRQ